MQVFMLFKGIVLLLVGVKLIYDARLITEKYFSVKSKNSAVLFLKVFGFVFTVIGTLLLYKYLAF